MKNIWSSCVALGAALSMALCFTACDDDDNKDVVVNTQAQWIGAPCECVGSDDKPCELMSVPVPTGAPITGCDNVPTNLPGAYNTCLKTISDGTNGSLDMKTLAPPVWFPQGYCTLGAVDCEPASEFTCKMASYGNVDEFKSCPEGSAMLSSDFEYAIMGVKSSLRTRTCAKLCNTDADCNVAGEMHCIERNNVHFCYNEKSFEYTGQPTVTAF